MTGGRDDPGIQLTSNRGVGPSAVEFHGSDPCATRFDLHQPRRRRTQGHVAFSTACGKIFAILTQVNGASSEPDESTMESSGTKR